MLSSAEMAWQAALVAASLDQTLTLSRDVMTTDSYGHQKPASTATSTIACNVTKPTASQLQEYADKIGSARSLILRAMQSTDIREGDHVAYDSLTWMVNGVLDAASYSYVRRYL